MVPLQQQMETNRLLDRLKVDSQLLDKLQLRLQLGQKVKRI